MKKIFGVTLEKEGYSISETVTVDYSSATDNLLDQLNVMGYGNGYKCTVEWSEDVK